MDQPIIKSVEEIETMRQGGRILAVVLKKLGEAVRPGVTTGELNELAEELILVNGAEPAFKNYCPYPDDTPFPTALCSSINEEVVHAPALPSRVLKEGDIVCLDLGLKYPTGKDGRYVDAAITVGVGKISEQAKKIISVTKTALQAGIDKVRAGGSMFDVSAAIQRSVEKNGFSVVRDLVGHGVGRRVHEPPQVPNFTDKNQKEIILKERMTICLEPMVCAGNYAVKTLGDGWTVVTADKKISAHFEHTVLVTKEGYKILTKDSKD